MSIPYSVRLFTGQLAANANSATFRPPAGYVWVINSIQTWIATAAATNYGLVVVSSTNTRIFEGGRSTTQQFWTWTGRAVIPQGDGFYAQAIGAVAQFYISGYQLTIT